MLVIVSMLFTNSKHGYIGARDFSRLLTQGAIMVLEGCCNLSYMDIGERIQKAREERGLTPTELARRMKVEKDLSITPQALYQIESGGTKNPKPQTLLAIAEVLGVDMVYIITGEQRAARVDTGDTSLSLEQVAELVKLYGMVSPELRTRAFRAARQALIDVGGIAENNGKTRNHA